MPSMMVIGTNIMRGTIPIGGMKITPAGFIGIIPNGLSSTRIGDAPTAIGTTIMSGIPAIGGTKTGLIGYANIIMSGPDGMTTTDE